MILYYIILYRLPPSRPAAAAARWKPQRPTQPRCSNHIIVMINNTTKSSSSYDNTVVIVAIRIVNSDTVVIIVSGRRGRGRKSRDRQDGRQAGERRGYT